LDVPAARSTSCISAERQSANESQKKYLGRTLAGHGAARGAIDHIAFRATGACARCSSTCAPSALRSRSGAPTAGAAPGLFPDPNGIKIELNFAASEGDGDL